MKRTQDRLKREAGREHRDETGITVVKADGARVPFDPEKIRGSLRRSGATDDVIDAVLEKSMPRFVDGMSTRALYRIVHRQLKTLQLSTAGKYHLKRAIMELGPSGFPFERLVARLLEAEGYRAEIDRTVQGHCVKHEVDVTAEKENEHLMVECKFHSDPGRLCDAKHALYVHARFLDLEKAWKSLPGHDRIVHHGWLVTNTRFSGDASRYGVCAGLFLLSWDYPDSAGLRELIDHHRLYPLTCLTTLTRQEKQELLAKRIVVARTVCEQPDLLKELRLPSSRMEAVMNEAHQLCEAPVQRPRHRPGKAGSFASSESNAI